jgi:hypothetical protein
MANFIDLHGSNVITCNLISSLSFNEYVLIDCLKFNDFKVIGFRSYSDSLDFVALTKQGFLNIFNELITLTNFEMKLFDNLIMFYKESLVLSIKYVRLLNKPIANIENNYLSKDLAKCLVDLPGLDFYKCYYDGVKMYCSPESIQCHKTGLVQYTGTLNLIEPVISRLIRHDHFKFKKEFVENNTNCICQDNGKIRIKHHLLTKYFTSKFDSFPTKLSVKETIACNGSKYVFELTGKKFNTYKENIYKFIEEIIFENPISNLC